MKLEELLQIYENLNDDITIIDDGGKGWEANFHADIMDDFKDEELNATIKSFKKTKFGFVFTVNESIYEEHPEYLEMRF